MPVISIFFGIIIRMYHGDHNPPHIHVQYGDDEAIIEIKSSKIWAGKLPNRVLKFVREWMKINRLILMKTWNDAQNHRTLKRIQPLE
ncbi:MAG: DUF4160 domain-containing protein [Gammaproteobacteria bacterium]